MEKRSKKNIKRIVIIGPESTGKTELVQFLAKKFNTFYIPEYAREYIEHLKCIYTYDDVVSIAKKQIELEKEFSKKANHILFFDTYLILTKVWFQVVFNKIPEWLDEKIRESSIDLFLLCNTELPWIPDNVRENGGEMREKLFEMYKSEIIHYGFAYEVISGKGSKRFENALKIVTNYINNKELKRVI
ncbi:MAG: AAA family ATPase [Bacteroidales bacterium]